MQAMQQKVLEEGKALTSNILKVDSFLNHQIDCNLMQQAGNEFYQIFKNQEVTKVLTIEASGIALGAMTAAAFNVPLVFAKKRVPSTMRGATYSTPVFSYTKETTYDVTVSAEFLSSHDRVLIIDDILAHGHASVGLINLVRQAGATPVGVGIGVEKLFQNGRAILAAERVPLHSLCVVTDLSDGKVTLDKEIV